MKKTRISALLLSLLMLTTAACGSSGTQTETTAATTDGTTAPETLPYGYEYPEADYGGHEFTFLNSEYQDWANVTISPEEANGDLVNDAMFERNSRISEHFNITIKEIPYAINDIAKHLIANVTAGDDAYDTYIVPLHVASGVLADGYLLDLYEIDSLNLDKPWWDQQVNGSLELLGKLMLTSSDISLFPFEATWAIFFNEDIMDDLGLEYPYELVREGKWTLDKLTEYAKAGALLNGDDGFSPYSAEKKSRYGFSTHSVVHTMVHSSGGAYARLEGEKPVFLADSERMITLYEKIAALANPTLGAYVDRDSVSPMIEIFTEFTNERVMMLGETIGHLNRLRETKFNFGVLPYPKLDENQENYTSLIASWGSGMTGIASTSENPERTGVILDALAFDSYISLMEPYYDTYLMQKGLRNQDSADMLAIIRDSRSVATDIAFGWTSDLRNTLNGMVSIGNSDVASTIASKKDASIAKIEKTVEDLKG